MIEGSIDQGSGDSKRMKNPWADAGLEEISRRTSASYLQCPRPFSWFIFDNLAHRRVQRIARKLKRTSTELYVAFRKFVENYVNGTVTYANATDTVPPPCWSNDAEPNRFVSAENSPTFDVPGESTPTTAPAIAVAAVTKLRETSFSLSSRRRTRARLKPILAFSRAGLISNRSEPRNRLGFTCPFSSHVPSLSNLLLPALSRAKSIIVDYLVSEK